MKVLIIEDEPRSAVRLQKMVLESDPSIEVVAVLESVADSIDFLSGNPEISLIFSDIHLSDSLSFDIYKRVKVDVPIIFTTAYDQYAIEAFRTNGIDYLLKPISPDQLSEALEKFKRLTRPALPDKLQSLARMLSEGSARGGEYKKRFMVKVGSHIKSIHIDQVKAFYSKDKASFIFTRDQRSYVIEPSLDKLEPLLDPEFFYRINRHFIVAFNAVSDIIAYSNSRLKLVIDGLEDELIIVSRDRTKGYKTWLGE